MTVVTFSSWLNLAVPRPREGGLREAHGCNRTLVGSRRWLDRYVGSDDLEWPWKTHVPFDLEWPNSAGYNIRAEGRNSRGHPRPHRKGGGQRSPIFGVPFYLCVHPLSQNYQIWRGNTCEGGACILESTTPPIPRYQSSSAPQFLGSPVFMPRPFNAERPNSA